MKSPLGSPLIIAGSFFDPYPKPYGYARVLVLRQSFCFSLSKTDVMYLARYFTRSSLAKSSVVRRFRTQGWYESLYRNFLISAVFYSFGSREISRFESYVSFLGIGFGLWPGSLLWRHPFVNVTIVPPGNEALFSNSKLCVLGIKLCGLSTWGNEALHADAFIGSNTETANNPFWRSYGLQRVPRNINVWLFFE